MPLLLLVSLYEFRQFLQIVLWIAVPATLIAIGLTIFFHYRRKKKQGGLELAFHDEHGWSEKFLATPASTPVLQATAGDHPEALPDWLASSIPDNTSLLKKYEQELRRYRENYGILEQDFRELEGRYTDLRNKAYHTDKESDTTLVEQLQQDIRTYKEKITHLQQDHSLVQQLQEENNRLQLLVAATDTAGTHHQDERILALQHLLAQAEAERKTLKEQLAGQQYLPDVLEERKAHIDFLQGQLEQRIKNYHTLEQQASESAAQLQQLQVTVNGFDDQIQQLTNELGTRQQQAAEWQAALEHSREEGLEQQQILIAKAGHIEQLEHNVHTLQEQQGLLQTEIADQQDAMRTLQESLATEQQKAATLETKLELSSQLLLRIYSELAKSLSQHVLVDPAPEAITTGNANDESEVLRLQPSLG